MNERYITLFPSLVNKHRNPRSPRLEPIENIGDYIVFEKSVLPIQEISGVTEIRSMKIPLTAHEKKFIDFLILANHIDEDKKVSALQECCEHVQHMQLLEWLQHGYAFPFGRRIIVDIYDSFFGLQTGRFRVLPQEYNVRFLVRTELNILPDKDAIDWDRIPLEPIGFEELTQRSRAGFVRYRLPEHIREIDWILFWGYLSDSDNRLVKTYSGNRTFQELADTLVPPKSSILHSRSAKSLSSRYATFTKLYRKSPDRKLELLPRHARDELERRLKSIIRLDAIVGDAKARELERRRCNGDRVDSWDELLARGVVDQRWSKRLSVPTEKTADVQQTPLMEAYRERYL